MPRSRPTERRNGKPFSSLEQKAMLGLARTAAQLDHDMIEVLKPYRLTPTQFNALRILRGAGDEGLCRNQVRDRLIARVPDATRLLDRLVETGLVVRDREGNDRRFVRARITGRGLNLLARLDPVILALHRRQLGHLGPGKLLALIRLLAEAQEAPRTK